MKVYWSKCGHGHGNFGDKITPMLLKHVGVPVEWAPPEHAELIGVGSILEKVPDNFKGTIWTTGFMHQSSRRGFSRARLLGVRGKLTLERINGAKEDRVVVGDAGLLCADLAPLVRKKHKLGIIPHFVDENDALVKAFAGMNPEVRIIDICADSLEVMRATSECEHILSSSLHGLILADSLGLPNRWMELNRGSEVVAGGGFKYGDYYSVFGLTRDPLQLTASTTLDDVIGSMDRSPRSGLEEVKARLRSSLLQIKDEVRPLTPEELHARHEAAADWQRRLGELQQVVAEVIPRGARTIVADEEQLRGALNQIYSVPFLERDGIYWGPPGSADEAIREARRQVQAGATWVIIAWPMFWMLENNPEFTAYLQESFECRHASRNARIFEWRTSSPE